jgi:hypothetical protein
MEIVGHLDMIALDGQALNDQANSPTLAAGLFHTVTVLDDAYARAFTQRFATWPEWNRPELWPIVTDPKRSEQRRWLSNALADLPADQGAKLLGRLQSNRSFQATYNQLATAVLLRESGLAVEYEPELPWQGKMLTPDIGLRGSDGGLAVIVEVSTRFRTAVVPSKRTSKRRPSGSLASSSLPSGLPSCWHGAVPPTPRSPSATASAPAEPACA